MPLHKTKLGEVLKKATFSLEDEHGGPLWIQHQRGQELDLAALPINKLPDDCISYKLPRGDETCEMAALIGMDAFILGFPKGIAHQQLLPIWKRGSIATEPQIPHEGLPVFLLDTATREGMSGAPVLLRSYSGYGKADGSSVLGTGPFTRFIGVYSGRFGADDELAVQLGRVWHRPLIDELLSTGVPGAYELRRK